MQSFTDALATSAHQPDRLQPTTLQVNVGKLCNQSCRHCHVDAGPHKKRENMDRPTFERLVELLRATPSIQCVDITGGAPELNPHFRWFIQACRALHLEVIDRCNLTVLMLPDQESTVAFLAEHQVRIIASLPCYDSRNVDHQRGTGVFAQSIAALQKLNQHGYGKNLKLDLVYNPNGPHLPPAAKTLEATYKQKLKDDFQIEFNELFTITNMPIKRFLADLKKTNMLSQYMNTLCENFNEATLAHIMCRSHISVSWDGKIFDCDFNQMLDLPSHGAPTLESIENFSELRSLPIRFANHCFGCTAGTGSSCTGSLI